MITIRKMVIEDYAAVYELWLNIPGKGVNRGIEATISKENGIVG